MTINFKKNIVVTTINDKLDAHIYIREFVKGDFAVVLNNSMVDIFRHKQIKKNVIKSMGAIEINEVSDIYVDIDIDEFVLIGYEPNNIHYII